MVETHITRATLLLTNMEAVFTTLVNHKWSEFLNALNGVSQFYEPKSQFDFLYLVPFMFEIQLILQCQASHTIV